MSDDFDLIGAPVCDTCGTVIESGAICKTCERDARERRRFIKPV